MIPGSNSPGIGLAFATRWEPPDLFARVQRHFCEARVPEERISSYLGLLLHRDIVPRPGGYEMVVRCRLPALLGMAEELWTG